MDDRDDKYDKLFKIILTGDSGVGKSNILSRYVNDEFMYESKSTIGVEFCTKTIFLDNLIIKVQIWDTAGQERFRAITRAYYRGSHGIIMVYDITSRKSFENIGRWVVESEQHIDDKTIVLLVGNKSDLEHIREVNYEEGQQFAENKKFLFIETSALNGDNINEGFISLVKYIVKNDCVPLDNDNIDENIDDNFTSNTKTLTLTKSSYNKPPIVNKKCC